ncbi:MAG: mobile mystery protein B [Saprospiraceae bacterium]|nr:mobile mystery protein B [Saprospiraceae bacterium]
MGLGFDYIHGQTPLDPDEMDGLLIPTIATQGELDEFEQQNIEKAIQWSMSRSFKADTIFSEEFIKRLHSKMFGDIWSWAGNFRKTNKNMDVDWWKIPHELKILIDDAVYWYKHDIYPPDEMAIRFKHRLVSIHCFSNGNGRHSRLMADIIIEKIFKKQIFTWGGQNLTKKGEARIVYLHALKAADLGAYSPLLEFAGN